MSIKLSKATSVILLHQTLFREPSSFSLSQCIGGTATGRFCHDFRIFSLRPRSYCILLDSFASTGSTWLATHLFPSAFPLFFHSQKV